MDTQKLIEYIEANLEKYLSFLCDICAFEGRAEDTDVINRMVDYIVEFANKEGFKTTRTAVCNCGDFLCIDINEGSEKSCVFLAHTDTVHKKGAFGKTVVTRLEDRIIAPGAIDCKGGIAIALLAMSALKANGFDGHVRLLLTSDEEVSNMRGGQAEVDYFTEKCARFPVAINCETSENDEVVVSRKGILRYNIDIKGTGGHSGIHYFECKNAIEEAAHKVIAFHSESKQGGITYSCNMIQSGNAFNTIPEGCRLSVDVRVPRHRDMAEAEKVVYEIAQKSYIGGTAADVIFVSKRPPMEKTPETMELFERLLGVCREYGLGSLTPVESGGGSDSCYTQAAGVTSICGMGGCGQFCHTDKEYISIESVLTRAKILALFAATRQG